MANKQSKEAAIRREFRKLKKNTVNLMEQGTVQVQFKKSNGRRRNMICTLNRKAGAVRLTSKVREANRNPKSDVCVVWDCKALDWRSFRWDRLERISLSL